MTARFQVLMRGNERIWALELNPTIPRSEIARMRSDGIVIEEIHETHEAAPGVATAIRAAAEKARER